MRGYYSDKDDTDYNMGYAHGFEAAKRESEHDEAVQVSPDEQFKVQLEAARACCPEGWIVVPSEATAEMIQAAEDRQVEGASYIAETSIQFALWREVWRAMIAASPSGDKE